MIMVEQFSDQCSSLSFSAVPQIELLHYALEQVREFLQIPIHGLGDENTITNLVKKHSGLLLISLFIHILICGCLNSEQLCGKKFHKLIKSCVKCI